MTATVELSILREIHRMVSSPLTWTQGGCARNAQGKVIDPFKPEAVCFCVFGASVVAQKGSHTNGGAFSRIEKAAEQLYRYPKPIAINDGRLRVKDDPHTAIVNCINLAISQAEAEIAAENAASASH
jgi:hypothetical protein